MGLKSFLLQLLLKFNTLQAQMRAHEQFSLVKT
jgi:hypothetical protein